MKKALVPLILLISLVITLPAWGALSNDTAPDYGPGGQFTTDNGLPPRPTKIPEPSKKKLFRMWLLTREDGSYCILLADSHPSVEAQKRLCFPGQDWVAENAIVGWVYDDGTWDLDKLGYLRADFTYLYKIYERRLGYTD